VLETSLVADDLRRCALFAHAGDDVLHALAEGMRSRRFRRGEVIFHQGDPGDSLQVVTSGSVKIVLSSRGGEEAIIATLHPGEFFGELALLDGAPRSTSATAIEPTETLSLTRAAFLELLRRDPHIVEALLVSLAEVVRRLTGHVEELHFVDLPGRLAKRIARLGREQSTPGNGRVELAWPYTQSDLAAMVGGTRQSVNRLLSELVDEGLLTLDRDTLIIHDLAALERRGDR
jgi:CRP-like cAMP-binding protein